VQFIGLSPFVVLASSDAHGHMDASPRGGEPGFAKLFQMSVHEAVDNTVDIRANPCPAWLGRRCLFNRHWVEGEFGS